MRWYPRAGLFAIAVGLCAAGCTSLSPGEFKSPEAAVQSFVKALRAGDTATLDTIFGDEADEVRSSGDPVADRQEIKRFLAAYDVKHRLGDQPDGSKVLIVGDQEWPFPVPIVRADNGYVFDTAAGRDEILNRRIGRNELDAEQVCLAIVDAQRDYIARRPMGGDLPVYAKKVMSDDGTRNGLFWPTTGNDPPSPLGPFVALAAEEGYGATRPAVDRSESPPYHGYRYRLLTAQGPHATGGAMNYEVDEKLVGGFAVVAFPAQYGNSGIMTFMTSHDGVLYQRDLGPDTDRIARLMTTFDPSPEWTVVTDDASASR